MSNIIELKPVNKVQNIINRFCYTIGMIPTSYKISMTYEEQVMAIGKYLEETVIPAVNNNAEVVQELQDAFITLKNYVDNYFDNLDVQEEINKKIDEMVENGTLQNILMNYSYLIKTFKTFSDVKNDNTLVENQIIQTSGFSTINDGGEGYYKITSTITILPISNNLYASPLFLPVNIMSLGAIPNNENIDNSNIIQYGMDNYSYIKIPNGKFYINNTLNIPSNIKIEGVNIKLSQLIATANKSYDMLSLLNTSNVILNNFSINGNIPTGNTSTYTINGITLNYNISTDSFSQIKNLEIFNCNNNGINILKQKETLFENLEIHNCGCGLYSKATDCRFVNITSYWNGTNVINNNTIPGYGFYIDQNSNSNKFINCKAHSNHSHGFYFRGSYNNLTNIEAQDNWEHGLFMYNCSNNNITNSTFSTNSSTTNTTNYNFNELCLQNVTNAFIEGNIVSRDISWSSSYAKNSVNLLNNSFDNILHLFHTRNINKPTNPITLSPISNFNEITINNNKYLSKDLLESYLLSSTIQTGLSDIFDNIISNDNDGSVSINNIFGSQEINYGPAQHTSPNGYFGVSKTITNKSVKGTLLALANYEMTNKENLVTVLQAQYFNNDTLLKQDRQFDTSGLIVFNKPIPDNTNKIILSFLVLSNKLNESGTIQLYNIKSKII